MKVYLYEIKDVCAFISTQSDVTSAYLKHCTIHKLVPYPFEQFRVWETECQGYPAFQNAAEDSAEATIIITMNNIVRAVD